MTSFARAAFGVVLVAALAPGLAWADDKAAAQKLLTEGNRLVVEGDYVGALEKFKNAYAAFPSPKILLNIGTTLRQLGRNADAAQAYERYLVDPGAEKAKIGEVRRALSDVEALTARVRIELDPSDAQVVIDGKAIAGFRPGTPIRIDAGEHTIVAEKAGLQPAIQRIGARGGQEIKVELKLAPPPVKTVVEPPSTSQRNIGFVIGGLGVVGVGVGAVFGLMAKSQNDEASQHCYSATICDKQGVTLGESASSKATVSTVFFLVGGGLVATGTVLYVTSPTFRAPSEAASPAVGIGPSGVVVSAKF